MMVSLSPNMVRKMFVKKFVNVNEGSDCYPLFLFKHFS